MLFYSNLYSNKFPKKQANLDFLMISLVNVMAGVSSRHSLEVICLPLIDLWRLSTNPPLRLCGRSFSDVCVAAVTQLCVYFIIRSSSYEEGRKGWWNYEVILDDVCVCFGVFIGYYVGGMDMRKKDKILAILFLGHMEYTSCRFEEYDFGSNRLRISIIQYQQFAGRVHNPVRACSLF